MQRIIGLKSRYVGLAFDRRYGDKERARASARPASSLPGLTLLWSEAVLFKPSRICYNLVALWTAAVLRLWTQQILPLGVGKSIVSSRIERRPSVPQSEKARTARPTAETLRPGYAVALALKEGAAPLRCYVGEVQEVDEHGVRLSLLDWIIGSPSGWDFFAPWESITSALVCTPEHHKERFGDAAGEFQTRCNYMAEGKEEVERRISELRQMKRGRE